MAKKKTDKSVKKFVDMLEKFLGKYEGIDEAGKKVTEEILVDIDSLNDKFKSMCVHSTLSDLYSKIRMDVHDRINILFTSQNEAILLSIVQSNYTDEEKREIIDHVYIIWLEKMALQLFEVFDEEDFDEDDDPDDEDD